MTGRSARTAPGSYLVAGRSFYHLGSANLIEDEIHFPSVDFFSFNVNLGGFVEDVHRHDAGLPIHTLEVLQKVTG